MEAVTPEMVTELRKRILSKIETEHLVFHTNDIKRIKNDDKWILRFVAGAENNMEEAVKLLYECCKWRKEFGVHEINESSIPQRLLDKGTLFIRGQDLDGKKLLVFKAKTHSKGKEDQKIIEKFTVYYFERIERLVQSDQISIIFDMKDTGWNNMDMDFVKYLISLLKTYYPFFVNYLVIFEMPWLLNAAWKIIKAMLPPKFVERVKFLDKKTLKDIIPVEHQLSEWGGTDDYVYKFEPEVRTKGNTGSSEIPRQVRFSGNEEVHNIDVNDKSTAVSGSPVTSLSEPDAFGKIAQVEGPVHFVPTDDGTYLAKFRIRNIEPNNASVIFKIKTTSPTSYKVKPTIGVLTERAVGTVTVEAFSYVSGHSVQTDKFQIQVAIIPPKYQFLSEGSDTESKSNFNEINSAFKSILAANEQDVETYKIGCTVQIRNEDVDATQNSSKSRMLLGVSQEVVDQKLRAQEKRITDNVYERVKPELVALKNCLFLLIILVLFLLFVVLLLYLRMPGTQDYQDACSSFLIKEKLNVEPTCSVASNSEH